jgi:NAD-dependent dihydropyrimidine dehydrogenase PreA subunit
VNNINKKNCSGCGGCVELCPVKCIKMEKSREGFYIARANEKNCINCGKCSAICSMNERLGNGVPLSAFAVCSVNETVRFNATSGGVFPTIAANFLEAGGLFMEQLFGDQRLNTVVLWINVIYIKYWALSMSKAMYLSVTSI